MEAQELRETTEEIGGHGDDFNKAIALAVVICAIFMALCKVKDDNIVQAMQADQVTKLDQWNLYQAKSLKQHTYIVQVDQGEIQLAGNPTLAARTVLEAKLAKWRDSVKKYDGDKAESKKAAEDAEKDYDKMNYRDDQFDLSDTMLGLAVALFALSSLVKSRAVFGLAAAIAGGGIVMGLAGFFMWHIHPDAIAKFLS